METVPDRSRYTAIYPSVDPLDVQAVAEPFRAAGVFAHSTLAFEDGRWHVFVTADEWDVRAEAAWDVVLRAAQGDGRT